MCPIKFVWPLLTKTFKLENKQTQVWLISIILFEVILKIFGWAVFKVTEVKNAKVGLSEIIFVDLTVCTVFIGLPIHTTALICMYFVPFLKQPLVM